MKLRIKFAKYGAVKFIGHLDIMRYFQKAIRRAGIDVAYTAGFSPHQIMSFAAPLGVGLESFGEYFDLEVHSYPDTGTIKEMLNKAMVPGIEILNVTLLPDNAGNAMASVAAAKYEVSFRQGQAPSFDWIGRFETFSHSEQMLVTKKTKRSEAELNLKPFIYSLSVSPEGTITMVVDSSSSGNIKPSLILTCFLALHNRELPEFALEITRLETYRFPDGDGEQKLVPMDCF